MIRWFKSISPLPDPGCGWRFQCVQYADLHRRHRAACAPAIGLRDCRPWTCGGDAHEGQGRSDQFFRRLSVGPGRPPAAEISPASGRRRSRRSRASARAPRYRAPADCFRGPCTWAPGQTAPDGSRAGKPRARLPFSR